MVAPLPILTGFSTLMLSLLAGDVLSLKIITFNRICMVSFIFFNNQT